MFRLPVSQKVILSYEWRNSSCIGSVSSGTRTNRYPTSPSFIPCCCECPNMFPWIVPMCNADTIYVHTVNGSLPIIVIGLEGICGMVLICSDSATDFWYSIPLTGKVVDTQPALGLPHVSYQSETWWAVLVGVSHVEVGHPHPPPSATTALLVMSQYSRDPYPVLVLWIQYQPEGLPWQCSMYLHEGAAFRKLPFGNQGGVDMCSASWLCRLVSWPCKLPNWSCRFVSWLCILASVWPLFSRVLFIS